MGNPQASRNVSARMKAKDFRDSATPTLAETGSRSWLKAFRSTSESALPTRMLSSFPHASTRLRTDFGD